MCVARDKGNPMRGNLVASGLREVVGHVLHGLAPDEEVRRCVWFERVEGTKKPTRRQRARYIVHAGLPEEFVEKELNLDVEQVAKPVLEAVDALSKATHVRPGTIVQKGSDVRAMLDKSLRGVVGLLDAAATSREKTTQAIADVMHEAVFQRLISEAIPELDELSTHTIVDDHYIERVDVDEMDATRVGYVINGTVEVELQYGSNGDVRRDIGFRRSDSCPYLATVGSSAAKPMDIQSDDVRLSVDNRSFFE